MAEEKWERCRICGIEWPDNALAECPQYRNSDHRKCRTNVRGQDVMSFVKNLVVADVPAAPELSDTTAVVEPVIETASTEGAVSDKLWPVKGKRGKERTDD